MSQPSQAVTPQTVEISSGALPTSRLSSGFRRARVLFLLSCLITVQAIDAGHTAGFPIKDAAEKTRTTLC